MPTTAMATIMAIAAIAVYDIIEDSIADSLRGADVTAGAGVDGAALPSYKLLQTSCSKTWILQR